MPDGTAKVVIFGIGQMSDLAWFSLTHDSACEVAGFTVDRSYRTTETHHGLPVVAFDEVELRFPRDRHLLLVPLGGTDMNRLRTAKYDEGRAKGYRFASYVSSRALLAPGLAIGENCLIFDGAIVQPFATIGRNTILRSGCHVSHHVAVGDHCFIASEACIGGGASVGERCFIGLNATVLGNVNIAPGCLIAAGALVTADTRPDGIYLGSPARRALKPAGAMARPRSLSEPVG